MHVTSEVTNSQVGLSPRSCYPGLPYVARIITLDCCADRWHFDVTLVRTCVYIEVHCCCSSLPL